MSTDVPDPWLTVAEIADDLRLTPATIRTWIADGTLQAKRAGKRKWLVRRSELDRMLNGEDYADAPAPPPRDPADRTPDPPPLRAPDYVTQRGWTGGEDDFSPQAWLRVAADQWELAITESQQAEPNRWFQRRLRFLGRTAAMNAAALGGLDADETIRWDPRLEGVCDGTLRSNSGHRRRGTGSGGSLLSVRNSTVHSSHGDHSQDTSDRDPRH